MKKFVTTIILLAFIAPHTAFGQGNPIEDFARAKALFTQGKYEQAVLEFENLLSTSELKDATKIVESYQCLGAGYFYLKNKEAAGKQFMRLLSIRPEYRMDSMMFPPDLVAFFEKIREELKGKLKHFEKQQKLLEEERMKLLEKERKRLEAARKIYIIKEEERRSYFINWLPFGVGQVQNEQLGKGVAFGLMQMAGLAMNIISYNFAESLRNERGYYNTGGAVGVGESDGERAKDAMIFQYIGLGIFAIGYGISIGDALYHYEPVVTNIRNVNGDEFHKENIELPPATATPVSMPKEAVGGGKS